MTQFTTAAGDAPLRGWLAAPLTALDGSGMGAILGVIVVLLLLVGIWFFAFGPGQGTFGGGTTQPNDINVNVELPSVAPEST